MAKTKTKQNGRKIDYDQTRANEQAAQINKGSVPDTYDDFMADFFRKHAAKDPTTQNLQQRLEKIQAKINSAANGGVNLRRGVFLQEIKAELEQAHSEYRQERKNMADTLEAQLHEQAGKKVRTTADRQADAMEHQLKYKAMTDAELEKKAGDVVGARFTSLKAGQFRDPIDFDAAAAELRSRGKNDLADELRGAMSGLPRNAIGDAKLALLKDQADDYRNAPDPAAVIIKDEQGRKIGADLESLIDYSGLERMPS